MCGVVGIHGLPSEVAKQTYFALFAVQHRGQESAGIATADGHELHERNGMGLVSRVFTEEDLEALPGFISVGHCRYSTTGSSSAANIQPIMRRPAGPARPDGCRGLAAIGPIVVAHNGNLVNAVELRNDPVLDDHARWVTSDTAVVAELIAHTPGEDIAERLESVLPKLRGSFSLVIATHRQLIGVRGGLGNRPLALGRLGDGWMLASETCAFDSVGATFERDVRPGEIVVIDHLGVRSRQVHMPGRMAMCAFEFIYFQRPDSRLDGRLIHSVRREMGRLLAQQRPTDADLVIGVPDSAIAAATGYAEAAGLPYADGFVRNRYIGRTFIEPTQRLRKLGARMKYNPLPEVVRGKRLVLLDDTIVRGTTQEQLVTMLREIGGAAEVHVRITAPPVRWPCFLGIDIPEPDELIAHELDVEGIRARIGADSLEFLDVARLVQAIGIGADQLCLGCFTRDYPVEVQLPLGKFVLERSAGMETTMIFPSDASLDPDAADTVAEVLSTDPPETSALGAATDGVRVPG
jgi:amidophosphoribosyltransferase